MQKAFDNWAAHQNWALENINFKNGWVFYLDADERMTTELRDEILQIARDAGNSKAAYYCGRRNYFMGQWIKHAMPPGAIMRFFMPDKVRFERLVNPTPVINGEHGYLRNYFDHYNFSKGLADWFDRHNRYSTLEALEGMKILEGKPAQVGSIFSSDLATRRRALKQISAYLPLRPLLKFIYMYLLKGGFLDGYPGFVYCKLQAMYEYMIVLKMREIRRLT